MSKAPCKNCPDRYLGCHDQCEKYQDFRVKRDKELELKLKAKEEEYGYYAIRKRHKGMRL